MRTLPAALNGNMNQGPFYTHDNGPNSYITVQTGVVSGGYPQAWWLNLAQNAGNLNVVGDADIHTLPYRWFIDQEGTYVETEVPNLKQVVFNDAIGQDASTLSVVIKDVNPNAFATPQEGTATATIGDPGYLSFTYGGNQMSTNNTNLSAWGQTPNFWQDVLRENALLRWYFGYGGSDLAFSDALSAGNVILKGLFLVDSVAIESQTGLITLTCRSIGGKLTVDQLLYPPLVPTSFYTSSGIEFYPPLTVSYAGVAGYGAIGEADPILTATSKEGFSLSILDGCVSSDGNSYALVGTDGRVFAYSDTIFGYGGVADIGDEGLNYLAGPVVSMECVPNGEGYWLCDSNGNIFNFGAAQAIASPAVKGATVVANNGLPGSILITENQSTITYQQANRAPETMVIPKNTYSASALVAAMATAAPDLMIKMNDGGALELTTVNGGKDVTLQVTGGSAATLLGFTPLPNPTLPAMGAGPSDYEIVAFRVNSSGTGGLMLDANGGVFAVGTGTSSDGGTTVSSFPATGLAMDGSGNYVILDAGGNTYGPLSAGGAGAGGFASDLIVAPVTANTLPPGSADEAANTASTADAIGITADGGGYWIVVNTPTTNALDPLGTYWLATVTPIAAPAFTIKGSNTWPVPLNAPVTSIRHSGDGNGFYLFAADGGVFTFGDADFFGSLPVGYNNWIASNYVSPYNTDIYVPVPPGTPPPNNASTITDPTGAGTTHYVSPTLLAPDYSQVARTLWAWAGGYFPPALEGAGFNLINRDVAPVASGTPPPLLGAIFDSQAYDCQKGDSLVMVVTTPPLEHGYVSTYSKRGCRCVECVEAQRLSHREWWHKIPKEDCKAEWASGNFKKGAKTYIENRRLCEIQPGDRVLSVPLHDEDNKAIRKMLRRTQTVKSVRKMEFEGELIQVVTADSRTSQYTPNHRCLVHIGIALRNKAIVYLMKKNNQFRVGRTGCKNGGMGGLSERLIAQAGDAVWVLGVFDTLKQAAQAEADIAYKFHLPQALFRDYPPRPNGASSFSYDLDVFWATTVGDNTKEADLCLVAFGRDIRYPFMEAGGSYGGLHLQRACNLIDGMTVFTVPDDAQGCYFLSRSNASTITVTSVPFKGDVYSIEVDEDHTYVADGILTHNSIGPIDSSTFDKNSVKSALNTLAQAIGYVIRWRDDGGIFFGLPNIWQYGNYLEDQSYEYTTAIPQFDGNWITDFVLNSTDQYLRSTILVSPVDPYIYDGAPPFPNENPLGETFSSTVTYYTPAPNQLQILHGIIKTAMIGIPLNVPVSPADQDFIADIQGVLCWLASRTGQLQAVYNPALSIDCQMRIEERVTASADVWYINGLGVTHNIDTGDCLATYTVNWMGDTDAWNVLFNGGSITNQTFDAEGNLILQQQFQLKPATIAALQNGGPLPNKTNNPTGYALFQVT